MKTRKTSFKKIISSLLCCSLVLELGWQLGANTVNAATTVGVNGSEVTLTADFSSSDVSITSDGNGYVISSDDFEDVTLSSISKIITDGPVNLHIKSDIATSIQMGEAAAQVYVDSGVTLECSNLSAQGGTFYNEGTMKTDAFIAQSLAQSDSAFAFINSGTIDADTINLSYAPSGFSSSSGAKYIASSSFTNGDANLTGIVEADRSTVIVNYGGSFTLQVNGASTVVDSYIESKSAYTLFDDPGVTLGSVPATVYVGQDYDFSTFISTVDEYDGTPVLEYHEFSSSEYTTEKPTAAGTYYVRAYAPSSGSYLEDYSNEKQFTIEYLDVSTQFPDGNYFTFGNVVDGKYVNGDVKVVPLSDAYQISFGGEQFADYVMVSEDDVLIDGEIPFPYVMFKLKDKNSDAETDNLYVTNTMSANFEALVFDTDTPFCYIDDEDERFIIDDGEEIMDEEPVIIIADRSLASVTIGDNTYTEDDFGENDYGERTYTASFTTTPGTSQQVTIIATDIFERESTTTVTLKSPYLGDVSASVAVNGTIFVDDEYTPSVTVTGTDEPYSVEFIYDNDEELEDQPTDAGTHRVKAIVFFEGYEETVETDEFEYYIHKCDLTPSVSVEDTTVGGEVVPVLSGIPADYEGEEDPVFEYKLSTAPDEDYSTVIPEAAGTYSVRATIPQTDKYEGATCENSFTISRKTLTASVSVEDIVAGNTPSPVLTKPNDYDGTITYEYKLRTSDDDAYTTDVPSAGGDYTVRATLASTAVYQGTTCTADFTISKITVTAYLEIDNCPPYYDYSPYLETDPESYDGNVIYEYKLSTDPDTAYSTTRPTAVGTYTVRATLEPTDIYEGTTVTDTFNIFKVTVDAETFTSDIYLGDRPEIDVEITSSHYDGNITYEYKLVSEPESAYTTDWPAQAGVFNVRVTLPETDMYYGTTLTDSFEVYKAQTDVYLTVRNVYVGEAIVPEIETDPEGYDGTPVYEYKLSTAPDSAYSTTLPTAAGTYTARVTLPETANFESDTDTDTFTISRKDLTAEVSVNDILVGGTIRPVVTKPDDYDGTITYEYKASDASDDAYSSSVPAAAGEYTVRANLPETDIYVGTSCTNTFTISRVMLTSASVSVDDVQFGESIDPVVTTEPGDYDGTISYEYKRSTQDDDAYTSNVPTAIGTYTVRATLAATDVYQGTTCEDEFTISKISVDAEVDFRGRIYYGGTPNPIVTTDPAGYDGTVTFRYKLSTEPDSAYSDTVPVNAGDYTVRATLPETDTYFGTACTADFRIERYSLYPEVDVDDVYYGETVRPILMEVRSDYDGVVIYEYKLQTDPDTAYSTTVPTASGYYVCKVTVPDTDNFRGGYNTDTFTIFKAETYADVTVNDIYVGEAVVPELEINPSGYDGTPVYEYKRSTDPDTSYSRTVPTAEGTYTVRVTLPETANFEAATDTDVFTINKIMPSANVNVADITIGETVSPVLTTTSDGKNDAVFEYKVLGAADSAYTRTVPTAAGTYTVRATVPETDTYLSISCTADFKINKIVAEASVSVADITVGGTVRPVLTTSSDGKVDAVFEYKAAGAPDAAYSAAVPAAAGTYEVRVTLPETANYTGIVCSNTFKIDLNEPSLELNVDDIYYGQKPDPSFSTNSNGAVVIMYKSSDAPDSAYTTVAPTDVGNYVARATVSKTGIYARNSAFAEFKISYLTAPKTAYTLSGTEGNNGFFTSDVELMAPDGYLISDSLGGEYAESIPYSGDLNAIYLKRIDDGALTSSIAIGETDRPKIDKDAPVFNTSSGSIDNGSVVYVSKLDVIANDPNLRSLTVNGKPVDLSSAGNILSLDPGYGFVEYTIVAEDEAGNITTFKFILMAEWRREGVLPPDVVLPLYVEETYKLDTGTWTVNDDTTVYNGGMPVYVNEDGDYTFTKVS